MQQQRPWVLDPRMTKTPTGRRQALPACNHAAAAVVSLFLVHELHAKAVLEDCLMSGRSNCDQLIPPPSLPDF